MRRASTEAKIDAVGETVQNPGSVLQLQRKTSDAWIANAIAHLDAVIVDHAHCEMKAASNALSISTRLFARSDLVRVLAEMAEEEMGHFRRVLAVLEERGVAFGPPPVDRYAADLLTRVKGSQRRSEPVARLGDRLLVSAAIEARSCERLKLLSESIPDPGLAAFYAELFASEARHFTTFVDVASSLDEPELVSRRLDEVMTIEAAVVATLHDEPAIHG